MPAGGRSQKKKYAVEVGVEVQHVRNEVLVSADALRALYSPHARHSLSWALETMWRGDAQLLSDGHTMPSSSIYQKSLRTT